MSIEISYGADGWSHSTHTRRGAGAASPVHQLAAEKGVSPDGCQTSADVEYRYRMLQSITKAKDHGWIL